VSLLAALSALGVGAFNARELGRRRPIMRNAKRAEKALDRAFDQRVDQLRPGTSAAYGLEYIQPPDKGNALANLHYDLQHGKDAASSSSPLQEPGIKINPNADRVYLAHEMGHLASQKTDIGHLVASLRANPKLKNALLGAMVTVPGVAAALEAGDDDMDTSLAMATLASAPTLVDEMLASKNGLAIMDTAGMRASLGQRGKLATGLLSYLAAPLIAGAAGNIVGNQFDADPSGL